MNWKIIPQTILALAFFFLVGGLSISEVKRKCLKNDINTLKNDLKIKQDSLRMMYKNDLQALEIINSKN